MLHCGCRDQHRDGVLDALTPWRAVLRSPIGRDTVSAMNTLPCNKARLMSRYCYALTALLFFSNAPRFEPVQPVLLSAGGAFTNAFADYDSDGDLDLFVGFNGAPNRLYRNDAGTLIDVAALTGVAEARATRAVAWGDYDRDGDPDLLVGFAPGLIAAVVHGGSNHAAVVYSIGF